MSTEIPTNEPLRVQAGDSLAWLKSLPDYPASDSWVLHYRLINSLGKFDISSSASGDDHLVAATATTTALYTPGSYSLAGWVTKSTERYSVYSGKVEVLPDLAAQNSYDTRSSARKILDLLDAAMVSQGSNAWVQEYEINGRSMKFRSIGEFIAYRSKIKQEVLKEESAERLKNGLSLKNKISVRF